MAVYGTEAPKYPGGGGLVRITLGWVIDRTFTPLTQKVTP